MVCIRTGIWLYRMVLRAERSVSCDKTHIYIYTTRSLLKIVIDGDVIACNRRGGKQKSAASPLNTTRTSQIRRLSAARRLSGQTNTKGRTLDPAQRNRPLG